MQLLPKLDHAELLRLIESFDAKDYYELAAHRPNSQEIPPDTLNLLSATETQDAAVLGIDIYRYSHFPPPKQPLIPFLFRMLYLDALRFCVNGNPFYFASEAPDFEKRFIDTGDGGFQILPTPLHALVFVIHFQILVRTFNSYHFYPKIREYLGPIDLRYVITFDTVYQYNDNFYGSAIINNSRIISKDRLNRLLIDQGTYEWFLLNTNGIESLMSLTNKELSNIAAFSAYDRTLLAKPDVLFNLAPFHRVNSFHTIDVLPIGTIKSKETSISVYNLHLQVRALISDENNTEKAAAFSVTIGNLNISGLETAAESR